MMLELRCRKALTVREAYPSTGLNTEASHATHQLTIGYKSQCTDSTPVKRLQSIDREDGLPVA